MKVASRFGSDVDPIQPMGDAQSPSDVSSHRRSAAARAAAPLQGSSGIGGQVLPLSGGQTRIVYGQSFFTSLREALGDRSPAGGKLGRDLAERAVWLWRGPATALS
jgi:hypothetical protein